MKGLRLALPILALTALSGISSAQGRSEPLLGVSVGVYMPTDSEIRDIFGSTWFQIGFSPSVSVSTREYSVQPQISFLSASSGGNRLFIVSVPIAFTKRLADEYSETVPFIGVGIGPAYFDYNITREGLVDQRFKASKLGVTAHAEVGVAISNRMKASARYVWFSESDGFKFNGLQLGVSYQFFKL